MRLLRTPLVVATAKMALPGLAILALLAVSRHLSLQGAVAGAVALVPAIMLVALLMRRDRALHDASLTSTLVEDTVAAERVEELEQALAALGGRQRESDRSHRAVLDLLPDPLILIDRDLGVRLANRAARAIFGDEPVGRPLPAMVRHPEILEAVDEVLSGDEASVEIEMSLPVPVARELTCRIASLERPSSDGIVAALVFRDLTQSKRVERMRADFVANASHEIRTPLAALGGYIETLLGPARDDAAARERFLRTMAEQVARMTRLVGDLLSLSRVELTEHTPPADPVGLGRLIARVVKALDFRAQDKKAAVEVILPDDLPQVVGDEGELEQVFTNLIDNAIKYGRIGGTVRVQAHVIAHVPARAGWPGKAQPVAIAVTDEGPGIPREHLPRLTERFYRVDAARSRDLGGTGLGLAIVKHIVNRHQGALTIDSIVGQGTTFTVYLPAASSRN
ncbi:hypothetical protein DKG75_07190 [Zavarzinia compransoris]|uniref:histidine kinase n=1 Tax=Zavarzinia compransoris TaxID=1264899 RepID=A0A317E716_9PROT|nr:ATP-binding protein [Zavarzinia compransoris]PWR22411.1 hypothetical protein DKG75_07190 [Zavarzinia compransoris]